MFFVMKAYVIIHDEKVFERQVSCEYIHHIVPLRRHLQLKQPERLND